MNKSVQLPSEEAQAQRILDLLDRYSRHRTTARTPPPRPVVGQEAWGELRQIPLDVPTLERNRIITAKRGNPAFAAFDVLRTKMLHALQAREWRRVGVTSPTKGCGKSFVSTNLAITLSRYENRRTVLLDMDMRVPVIARRLGVREPESIGDFLRGAVPPKKFLCSVAPNPCRIGNLLALGLNGRREPFASELLQSTSAREALLGMETSLDPDIVLFDLPPILAQDDVLALKPHLDCIVMVAGGGITTPRDLREASQRLGDDLPILGVILNKAEGEEILDYSY